MVRRAGLVALALALMTPATADARRVTLKIHPQFADGRYSGPALDERVRLTLPSAGRVDRIPHGRVWTAAGGCRIELEAIARERRAPRLETGAFARLRLANPLAPRRVVYVHATGCQAASVLRTARLYEPRRPCGATGKTIAANDLVRIYSDGRRAIACARATLNRFSLGPLFEAEACSGYCHIDHIKLAGRFVAFASEDGGKDGNTTQIVLRDALTGARLRSLLAGRDCDGDPRFMTGPVQSLALHADGRVAWIADRYCEGQLTYEVHTLAGLLTAGPRISSDSLLLEGETIRWIQEGAWRSAPL